MKIEIFEGRRAEDYDKNIPLLFPGYHMIQEQLCSILGTYLLKEISPEILVAGCGTGSEMLKIIKYNDSWKVTGIDPSPQMIDKAKDKLSSENKNSYKLHAGLVGDLAKGDKFDAGILQLVLHFLPDNGDKLSLLKDISEKLKPNAPFILVDIFGDKDLYDFYINQLQNLLLDKKLDKNIVDKMLTHIRHDLFICNEARQLELLSEAGFRHAVRFFQNYMYGSWVAFKK